MTAETDTLAIPTTGEDAGQHPGADWQPRGDGLRAYIAGICWATVAPVPLASGEIAFAAIVDGEPVFSSELGHPLLFRRQRDALAAAWEAVQALAGSPWASQRNAPDAGAAAHDRCVDKQLYLLARAEGAVPHLAAWRHSTRQHDCDVWTLDVSGRSAAVVQMPFYGVWRRCYAVVGDGGGVVADGAGNVIEFESLLPAMRAAVSEIGI
jgi:hypothetical protein